MLRYFTLLISVCAIASAANWLTLRGDPQRTGWQQDERALNPRTVKQLHLLWKLDLGSPSNSLTDPFILGPIITHRGIKELVFAKDSAGTVSAVDADLGRIYWTRSLSAADPRPQKTHCADDLRIMPVMAPAPIRRSAKTESDDEFSDGNKPIYALSGAGMLYALRPSTGDDFSPPLQVLSADAHPLQLDVANNTLYITTSSICRAAADRVLTLNLSVSPNQIGKDPSSSPIETYRQLVFSDTPQTAFNWKGTNVLATLTPDGKLAFADAPDNPVVFGASHKNFSGGIATWQNEGERFLVVARAATVELSRITDNGGRPMAISVWKLSDFPAVGSPVVANGIVYFLVADRSLKPSCLSLRALDARTGAELYKSSDISISSLPTGNLALANGHVAFVSADGVLYCFGIPFEM